MSLVNLESRKGWIVEIYSQYQLNKFRLLNSGILVKVEEKGLTLKKMGENIFLPFVGEKEGNIDLVTLQTGVVLYESNPNN